MTLSIVGTSDLHGHLERLPWLGGFVANLRAARRSDGGVLLVDAGDMFQGTLASNLNEGAAVVDGYNTLGYAAAAIGNHEFDYGPSGPVTLAVGPQDDPQGALRARAVQARFPFLAANLRAAPSGSALSWEHVEASLLLDVAGIRVGLVGVTTEATARTTASQNLRGVRVASPAEALTDQARSLRARGALVVVALAHLGGACRSFRDPADLSACDAGGEVFDVVRALPAGLVDVVVAGHTHQAIAHRVNGVAVIESFAEGRAFGRVDVQVDPVARRVLGASIHPPHAICGEREGAAAGRRPAVGGECAPGDYEGAPVHEDARVALAVAPAIEAARAERQRSLLVRLESPVVRSYDAESPLGNLVADMMLASHPDADAALTNGGGIRADLPAGELSFGQLYEALPFDNRLVEVRIRGAALRELIARNLAAATGVVCIAGVRATAECRNGSLAVTLARMNGRAIGDDEELRVLTSDFLATGGDGMFREVAPVDQGDTLRDAVAAQLRARAGVLRGDDPALFDPARRRLAYPGQRPVRCAAR